MSQPPIPPRTDEDTFTVLDDALTALAQRRNAWLGDENVVIGLLASLIDQALRALPEAITTARANGASWTDIAILTGTSAEEAQLRFDPDSPIADGRWPWPTDPPMPPPAGGHRQLNIEPARAAHHPSVRRSTSGAAHHPP